MIHEGNNLLWYQKSLSNSVCKFVVSFGTILTCDCLQNIQCSLLYSCKTKKDISYSWKIRILQEMLVNYYRLQQEYWGENKKLSYNLLFTFVHGTGRATLSH